MKRFLQIIMLICGCFPLLTCLNTYPTDKMEKLGVYHLKVQEPSGLSLDPDGQHLWMVSDTKETAYKTNLKGKVVAKVKIKGKDLEGIATTPGGDTLIVVDESKQVVRWFDLNGEQIKRVKIDIPADGNSGLEGIDVNPKNGDIYVVNEKSPRILLHLDRNGIVLKRYAIAALSDISSVLYNPINDRIWLMSDIDRKIMIFNKSMKPVVQIPIDIIQMEGMAIDFEQKILYIISDREEELHVFQLKS